MAPGGLGGDLDWACEQVVKTTRRALLVGVAPHELGFVLLARVGALQPFACLARELVRALGVGGCAAAGLGLLLVRSRTS